MARRRNDGFNPWYLVVGMITMLLTGIGLFFAFRTVTGAAEEKAAEEDDDRSALESFLAGDGFLEADGLFGTGWLSKII